MPIVKVGNCYALTKFCLKPTDIAGLLKRHTADYHETAELEAIGADLVRRGFPPKKTAAFVERVCIWGRGHRNVGRVLKKNTPKGIADALREGHAIAKRGDVAAGVIRIENLRRLGISYASKQLRILLPNRAVILDSVIRVRLGYAESERGYRDFLSVCNELLVRLKKHPFPGAPGRPVLRVCDVEAAIYQILQESA
ncbi:MAG: hypothetical protein VW600_17975 [Ferrovibrio sp.]